MEGIIWVIQRAAIFGCCAVLAACGAGNDSSSTSPTPDSIPVGTSVSSNISPQQNAVHLAGLATVTLSQTDATTNPTISVGKAADPTSAQLFADVQEELEIRNGSSYEVVVTSTVMPTSDVAVELVVPASLASQAVQPGQALSVYYEDSGDDDQPGGYLPLQSAFDTGTKILSASLPPSAFDDQGNGIYKAKIKIGLATAYDTGGTPIAAAATLANYAPQSKSAITNSISLICPLGSLGCSERSMFNRSRLTTAYGKPVVKAHRGVDFVASLNDVFAALSGTVLRYDSNWGSLVVKDKTTGSIIKYTHLLFAYKKTKGDQLALGENVGVSSNTAPPNISLADHLHFELIIPKTSSCVQSGGVTISCSVVQDYHDPFPSLISSSAFTATPASIQVSSGNTSTVTVSAKDKSGNVISSSVGNADENIPGDPTRKLCFTPSPSSTALVLSPGGFVSQGPGQSNCVPWQSSIQILDNGSFSSSSMTETIQYSTDPSIALTSNQLSIDSAVVILIENFVLQISPSPLGVSVGGTGQLKVTATDANNNVIPTPTSLQWDTSDPTIATVNQTGLVTGVAAGTATITVTDPVSGGSATTTVRVEVQTASIGNATSYTYSFAVTDSCGSPSVNNQTGSGSPPIQLGIPFSLTKWNGSWVAQSSSFQGPVNTLDGSYWLVYDSPAPTGTYNYSLSSGGLFTATLSASGGYTKPVDGYPYIVTNTYSLTETLDLETGQFSSHESISAQYSDSDPQIFCPGVRNTTEDIYINATFPITLVPPQ